MLDIDIRQDLALAHRIIAHLKLDDHTYTHISMRPAGASYFYIAPFGLIFNEVMPGDLIQIPLDKSAARDIEENYNLTGYMTHSSLYNSKPEINAAIHLHTPEIVAVSSIKDGLMPLSQWALHFYEKVSYANYDSLILDTHNGNKIAASMGDNKTLLMRNHGSLTIGKDIQEAMFYTYHLQKACEAQILTLSMGKDFYSPEEKICKKAVKDLLSFEENLGHRDWKAWRRLINF
ncbi:MAG: hypothetical protein RLZZ59_863 [Pseudomonadota bacterium]|jgi:ribulose-5-phosphate 4-epimerase/fuculose-1-phosphate aldolase